MTVSELVEKLNSFPPEAHVMVVCDGARGSLTHAYESKGGLIYVGYDDGSSIYHDEDRPRGAPSRAEVFLWRLSDDTKATRSTAQPQR